MIRNIPELIFVDVDVLKSCLSNSTVFTAVFYPVFTAVFYPLLLVIFPQLVLTFQCIQALDLNP